MNGRNDTLNLLLVEDDQDEFLIIKELLLETRGNTRLKLHREDRLEAGIQAAEARPFDAVLLDLTLPDSRGLETVRRFCARHSKIPVIVLTGLSDQDTALQTLKEGAQDYLVKGLADGHLLWRALRYAIERKRLDQERQQLIEDLQKALSEVKTLRGLVPICACCKKIRDDRGFWKSVESYVQQHSEAQFTHGYCPDCEKIMMSQ